MKKSVFLAYAEDSDDDTTSSRHQGDRSAKNSKQKQKQKAKKQEDNSLKNLAMSTSKKSKKKKNTTGNAAGENDDVIAPAEEAVPAAAAVNQITVELEKTTIDTPPPATISYAQASASTKPQAKQQQPPKQHTKQPVQQPQPKSQPQTSKPPGPTPPAPERQKAVQPPTPERMTTPPPNGVHTVNEVTYLPSQIKVLLPGQPEQVLDVAEVMQRAQYFKQTAESLLAVNRNGEMENAQLREHLAQALVRLEQLEHDNRVLQQLNLNLQTELARLKPFNNGIRPPGL